ncbi:hypothetical protein [Planosporangium mesophilum]|nr:hypothetical protein [Planosporangium mesophilum]
MLVLVSVCLAAGWWQIDRARGGNTLSFGYALEWPLFAAFIVFVWYKEVRAELRKGEPEPDPEPTEAVPADLAALPGYIPFDATVPARATPARPQLGADDGDPDLVAYNRYLEWLAANPGRRPSEYPRSEG